MAPQTLRQNMKELRHVGKDAQSPSVTYTRGGASHASPHGAISRDAVKFNGGLPRDQRCVHAALMQQGGKIQRGSAATQHGYPLLRDMIDRAVLNSSATPVPAASRRESSAYA